MSHTPTASNVYVTNSTTEVACCLPPGLWQHWADSYERPASLGSQQMLQVFAEECLESPGCISQRVVLLDFATTLKQVLVGGQYLWRARDFTFNCKSSLTQDCIDERGQSSCLEECLLAAVSPPPLGTSVLNDLQAQQEQEQQNEPTALESSPSDGLIPAGGPQTENSSNPTHSTAVVASIASALGELLRQQNCMQSRHSVLLLDPCMPCFGQLMRTVLHVHEQAACKSGHLAFNLELFDVHDCYHTTSAGVALIFVLAIAGFMYYKRSVPQWWRAKAWSAHASVEDGHTGKQRIAVTSPQPYICLHGNMQTKDLLMLQHIDRW